MNKTSRDCDGHGTFIMPIKQNCGSDLAVCREKVGSVPFSVSAAISTKPVSFGYRCKVS